MSIAPKTKNQKRSGRSAMFGCCEANMSLLMEREENRLGRAINISLLRSEEFTYEHTTR